tara:strand:- start:188993 stop:189193 length:201 start_codon:yes stop_codon:yes gene_type:complete
MMVRRDKHGEGHGRAAHKRSASTVADEKLAVKQQHPHSGIRPVRATAEAETFDCLIATEAHPRRSL